MQNAIDLTIADRVRYRALIRLCDLADFHQFTLFCALLNLYGISNLVKFGLFDESEEPLLRKCVMLYAVIAADTVPERFDLSGIGKLQPYKIKTDLLPVLRHGEYFDLAVAREETIPDRSAAPRERRAFILAGICGKEV